MLFLFSVHFDNSMTNSKRKSSINQPKPVNNVLGIRSQAVGWKMQTGKRCPNV